MNDFIVITAEPWQSRYDGQTWYIPGVLSGCDEATAKVVVLLQNAFRIVMRRGWNANRWNDGKFHLGLCTATIKGPQEFLTWIAANGFDDPATCVVEAEKWYVANVANG